MAISMKLVRGLGACAAAGFTIVSMSSTGSTALRKQASAFVDLGAGEFIDLHQVASIATLARWPDNIMFPTFSTCRMKQKTENSTINPRNDRTKVNSNMFDAR